MQQKELTKTFVMILEGKNPSAFMVDIKYFRVLRVKL